MQAVPHDRQTHPTCIEGKEKRWGTAHGRIPFRQDENIIASRMIRKCRKMNYIEHGVKQALMSGMPNMPVQIGGSFL